MYCVSSNKTSLQVYKLISKLLLKLGLGKSPVVLKYGRIVRSKVVKKYVEIDGNKMFLDFLDSLNLSSDKIHEEFERILMKKLVKENDHVIDIGAHIGYYTLLLAKLVGKNGRVFAFEPESQNFELLKKNIEINGYQNVILEQKGVSDKTGKCKLYLSSNNTADNRTHETTDVTFSNKNLEIQTVSLNDYFKNYDKPIRLIKMDIQGGKQQ